MSRCLIALLLVSLFPAIALAWGLERNSRRADHRHVELTYKHHRSVELMKTGETVDLAFQREYWEPCNSTFREYIVNGCDSN